MKLRDVKFAIPQIHKELLLNETLNMKLECASLKDGTVIIDSTHDKLIKCRLDNCKIISHVPLTIDRCYIEDHIGGIKQTESVDKDTPHAIIEDCFFNLCKMPKGDYRHYYIRENPQSSSQLKS